MLTYRNDTTWPQIQAFLPAENQLNEHVMPEEYYLNIHNMNVHIDHYRANAPKARVIMFHGVGGNGRLLSSIALPLRRAGFDVICPDMPLYGYTVCSPPVTYETWIATGNEIVRQFQQDHLPIVLFGLSAGGMLAYQIAAQNGTVSGLIASCILDQRDPAVMRGSVSNPIIAAAGVPLMKAAHRILGQMKLPMKLVANMKAISNDPQLTALLMKDPKSSGVRVPLSFLYSMLTPAIQVEPEQFDICPFLLVHPGDDRWTDVTLSRIFYDRLACPKKTVILDGAGHFPFEKTGLRQLEQACIEFLNQRI